MGKIACLSTATVPINPEPQKVTTNIATRQHFVEYMHQSLKKRAKQLADVSVISRAVPSLSTAGLDDFKVTKLPRSLRQMQQTQERVLGICLVPQQLEDEEVFEESFEVDSFGWDIHEDPFSLNMRYLEPPAFRDE